MRIALCRRSPLIIASSKTDSVLTWSVTVFCDRISSGFSFWGDITILAE